MTTSPPLLHETGGIEAPRFTAGMDQGDAFRATANLAPDQLIKFWSTFESTADLVCPSVITGRTVDDVAAVVAGSKPATILRAEHFFDPSIYELLTGPEARSNQLSRAESFNHYGQAQYFIGKEHNVRTLAHLFRGRGYEDSPLPPDEDFHRGVGKALGYPDEAVEAFIVQTARSKEDSQRKHRFGSILGKLGLRN